MALTVSQIINLAAISEELSLTDIMKSGLDGGGIDLKLPRKIYCIRKNVSWASTYNDTSDNITATSNYLLSICGKYYAEAAKILGSVSGGNVTPIAPINTTLYPKIFTVSASSFIATGESSITITDFIGYNLLFIRGGIPQTTLITEPSYYSWDKTTGSFTCSPAAIVGEIFQLYPFV